MDAGPGVLALMGSGETSPTMVTLHRELAAGLEGRAAVILETPYGFQVNCDDISVRARDYFRRSVGLSTTVARETGPGPLPTQQAPGLADSLRDQVRRAAWVFSGPGSPSYALERWHAQHLGEILHERIGNRRGVTVMASAAACTVGFAALPVYEVYKAGHPPAWLEGLDLLGALGLPVAVIPHYDNAEGGTHDTRFCYLGEARLSMLERELPAEAAVLGIDEHTAVVIDLAAASVRVWGKGAMTVRRRGAGVQVPAGATVTLQQLRDLVSGRTTREGAIRGRAAVEGGTPGASSSPATLQEAVTAAESRFDAARTRGDAATMVAEILDLETVIAAWASDMEEDQGGQWARTVLRGMIRQLAPPTQRGMAEPARSLGRALEPVLELRRQLRTRGAFEAADQLREALAAGGVRIRDTSEGSTWHLTEEDSETPAPPASDP